MKFEMYRAVDQALKDRSVICRFTNGEGRTSTTWFSAPPDSIDHVDIKYLRGRFSNVVRREQMEFIKRRFKQEMKKIHSLHEGKIAHVIRQLEEVWMVPVLFVKDTTRSWFFEYTNYQARVSKTTGEVHWKRLNSHRYFYDGWKVKFIPEVK